MAEIIAFSEFDWLTPLHINIEKEAQKLWVDIIWKTAEAIVADFNKANSSADQEWRLIYQLDKTTNQSWSSNTKRELSHQWFDQWDDL